MFNKHNARLIKEVAGEQLWHTGLKWFIVKGSEAKRVSLQDAESFGNVPPKKPVEAPKGKETPSKAE